MKHVKQVVVPVPSKEELRRGMSAKITRKLVIIRSAL